MYVHICVHMCIHMRIGRVYYSSSLPGVSNYYALSVTVLLKCYIVQLHCSFTLYIECS